MKKRGIREFGRAGRGAVGALMLSAGAASGAPIESPWVVEGGSGGDDSAGAACASVSGWYAVSDTFDDAVEIRDVRQSVVRVISRAEIAGLIPWMNLDGGPDGPGTIAFTDSGKSLYILVHDDAAAPAADGFGSGSDAILRYDAATDAVSMFARVEAFDRGDISPNLAMVHYKGRLYVGTSNAVWVYGAGSSQGVGVLQNLAFLPDMGRVVGLSVDRAGQRLYAASENNLYRANVPAAGAGPTFILIGSLTNFGGSGMRVRSATWCEHFGAADGSQRGLYAAVSDGTSSGIVFVSASQATGNAGFSPTMYATRTDRVNDVCASADGGILAGLDEDAVMYRDTLDTRLTFDGFLADEFSQQVRMARGLISPDGEPVGWVIDADTAAGTPRFHPATPDAAGWAVMMLIAAECVSGDAAAPGEIRGILKRYSGLSGFPSAQRNADGIYQHWINPATGLEEWTDGFSTLSTMKLAAAADRARRAYPEDAEIARAASRIVFGVKNWGAYVPSSPARLYYKGLLGGGVDAGSASSPFNEGIIFVNQAGVYGGASASEMAWLTRGTWPTASYVSGLSVTGDVANGFQSAFVSLYPMLVMKEYRNSIAWQEQVQNVRWSHAGWTDDHGPRFYTVFSAGTTDGIWGGYNADSITNHPGNVTTFTSLLAFGAAKNARNGLAECVAGYEAYRRGARQTFATGATMLYRRSDVMPGYTPNSAGLPDVTLGGLGLAEVLSPGFLDEKLAVEYGVVEMCPVDVNGDGAIDEEDLYVHLASPTDLSGNGVVDSGDWRCLMNWLRRNEGKER